MKQLKWKEKEKNVFQLLCAQCSNAGRVFAPISTHLKHSMT